MKTYKEIYKEWCDSPLLGSGEKSELFSIEDNEKEKEYRFGKDLEFGTAGMRGIVGMGTNMMNVYTVRRATQGLADYIKSLGKTAALRGVVISYDTRHMSYEFAYAAAVVLVSNGIKAYLFRDVHPVPMLSFAVRRLKTAAGIMITASHNPKEYNGYKIYGEDGAQMSPEDTARLLRFIEAIESPLSDKILYDERREKRIIYTPKSVDRSYYRTIKGLRLSPKETKQAGKTIKLVYTPVHGSGYVPVTTILKKIGVWVTLVPEQIVKDPDFSTVKVPNPEYMETLTLAIKMADFKQADVVFGTDPDCDRLGVAVRDGSGEFTVLSGNQTGSLLLDYILLRLKETGRADKNGFAVKSFVTTSLAKRIADDYGVELFDVPVGFKYIGEKIKQYDDTGKRKFIFGFEESCGYLRGTHCRDKDAVVASMLFAEMVCYYNCRGKSVYSRLMELYGKYGFVLDRSESVLYGGLNAMRDMSEAVEKLRAFSPASIGGVKVEGVRDYLSLKRTGADGTVSDIDCSPSNAVYYELEGGGFICVRPSGTEPKLKIYYSVAAENEARAEQLLKNVKAEFALKTGIVSA